MSDLVLPDAAFSMRSPSAVVQQCLCIVFPSHIRFARWHRMRWHAIGLLLLTGCATNRSRLSLAILSVCSLYNLYQPSPANSFTSVAALTVNTIKTRSVRRNYMHFVDMRISSLIRLNIQPNQLPESCFNPASANTILSLELHCTATSQWGFELVLVYGFAGELRTSSA